MGTQEVEQFLTYQQNENAHKWNSDPGIRQDTAQHGQGSINFDFYAL
jgi:hypothetical protein